MRTLFFCCSVYQLFNALNIRLNVLPDDTADMMVSDTIPGHHDLAERLRATGLFEEVYEPKSSFISNQKYKHTRTSIYSYHIFPELLLRQVNAVPKHRYDRYYFATYNEFISFLYLYLHKKNKHLQCRCFEDGGSTYMRTFQSYSSVDARLYRWLRILPLGYVKVPLVVYEPQLMTFDNGAPVETMPKISDDDTAFFRAVNTVFGIDQEIKLPQRAIFFEESFLADGLKNNDAELITICAEAIGSDQFLLKPHPRNRVNRFQDTDIHTLDSKVPWEVFCMNADLRGKLLLSANSNAAISPHIIFKNAPKTVLLYNLLEGDSYLRGKPEYDAYYDKILELFPGEIVAPKTREELLEALKE